MAGAGAVGKSNASSLYGCWPPGYSATHALITLLRRCSPLFKEDLISKRATECVHNRDAYYLSSRIWTERPNTRACMHVRVAATLRIFTFFVRARVPFGTANWPPQCIMHTADTHECDCKILQFHPSAPEQLFYLSHRNCTPCRAFDCPAHSSLAAYACRFKRGVGSCLRACVVVLLSEPQGGRNFGYSCVFVCVR